MIDFSGLKIKQDIDRVYILQWGHFYVLTMAVVVESFLKVELISMLFFILCLMAFYKFYFKTIKDLYYSFWTFSGVVSIWNIYKLVDIVNQQSHLELFYLYLIAQIILTIQMYILLSPIYYPRVSWWEYDFRYRDDLKVKLTHEDVELEGRMTDLRRKAGCLSLFKEVPVGSKVKVFASNGVRDFSFMVEVMSKRQYSLGRPVTHGVRFVFSDEFREEDYYEFYSFWVNEKESKSKARFKRRVESA